jgi:hypothetical protein
MGAAENKQLVRDTFAALSAPNKTLRGTWVTRAHPSP